MTMTPYHAKYFAHDLTRRAASGMDRLSMSLFDAAVDLNPHQIEAALFALESPLSKGVILADEVGLGKTIEAGIVLCQFWAERKRRLLVLCPASLRKQWALELEEKFNLPTRVLDAKAFRDGQRSGRAPLNEKAVLIISFNYANAQRDELKAIAWDLVVVDEAHKLRNAYRPSNKVGQGIRWATEDCRKLLLTATPLQNSLLELFGLSTLIDEHLFGDINAFRAQYASAGSSIADLRQRLSMFCKRTLRNQVTEYIRYTERRPITRPFAPSDDEHALYEAVSGFLQRPDSYLPQRQRHLTALILRKLLASSSQAIGATLDTLRTRLEALRDEQAQSDPEFTERLIEAEEIEGDLLDEILEEDEEVDASKAAPVTIDRQKLREGDRHSAAARHLGARHRYRHQDAHAAQGAGHRLRADDYDGRGAQGSHLHRVAPHPGLPENVSRMPRLSGAGGALQRHQRRAGIDCNLRAMGGKEPRHRPRLRLPSCGRTDRAHRAFP
jgi:SNF2-related domain